MVYRVGFGASQSTHISIARPILKHFHLTASARLDDFMENFIEQAETISFWWSAGVRECFRSFLLNFRATL